MVRKAVVMAGGFATRLRPLTTATNKHMLPIYDRPIIQRVVETIVASGVEHILIHCTNPFSQPILSLLQDGRDFGCSIYYSFLGVSDSVARNLESARRWIGDEPFLLMLGDSFYRMPLCLTGIEAPHMWVMPLDGFDDFRKYAEVTLDEEKRVTSIVPKVEVPKSGLIATGAWVLPSDIFDRAAELVARSKGEVKVRHFIQGYVDEGKMRATVLASGAFLDLGTFDALLLANTLAKQDSLLKNRTAAE